MARPSSDFVANDLNALAILLATPFSNHAYDDLWATFVLLETKGIDVSIMQRIIAFRIKHSALDEESFFFGKEITHEEEKIMVCHLRNKVRLDAGLAPLTERECQTWNYPLATPLLDKHDRVSVQDSTWTPSDLDVLDEVNTLNEARPELLRGYAEMARANSYARGKYELSELGGDWVRDEITISVANHRPDLSSQDVMALSDSVWKHLNSFNAKSGDA